MIKAVIFDIDGVLLDSFESNYRFMSDLVSHFGYHRPTRKFFSTIFHYSLYDSIRVLTSLTSGEKVKEIAKYGLSNVVNGYIKLQKLPKGGTDTIKNLNKKYSLAIMTTRVRQGVYEIPALMKLRVYFSVICCYEDTKKHKPDPEPLLFVTRKLHIKPVETVYIGDVENDIKAARNAGTRVIIYSKNKIEGADARTSVFKELPQLIAKL